MTYFTGDRVQLTSPANRTKFPGIWTVEKVNPVNLALKQVGRRPLRCHPSLVERVTASEALALVVNHELPPHFELGELVRFKNDLCVVIKVGSDRVNVAKLGDDAGRYWRTPPTSLKRLVLFPDPLDAGAWLAPRTLSFREPTKQEGRA